MPPKLLIDLPADVVQHILVRMVIAHHIGRTALTCKVVSVADKTVKLFNVNDGAVLRTFKHHTRTVTSLALLPDGLRFVSGSDDQTARIAYHGLYHGLAP